MGERRGSGRARRGERGAAAPGTGTPDGPVARAREFLSLPEAAGAAGVSAESFRRRVRYGEIPVTWNRAVGTFEVAIGDLVGAGLATTESCERALTERAARLALAEARLAEATAARPPTGLARMSRAYTYPLYLLMAILAIDTADRYLLSSVFPLVKEEFHLSDSQLGTLSAAFFVVATLGAVPFGIMVDRWARTRLVAVGTAVWSLAMVFTGLARSFGALFGARMFLGVAVSTYGPASFSLIADYYPVEERAKRLGIFQLGGVIGFLTLPIGGFIAGKWGWQAAFHFYAIPGFVLAMLAWRLPEPERGRRDREHQRLEHVEAGTGSAFARMGTRQAFGTVLRIPTVIVSLVTGGLTEFFLSGLGIWAATFLIRYHDMSVAQASGALAVLAIGAIAGTLLGGILSDRLVRRGNELGRIHVAAAAQILGLVLLFPAYATDSTPLMMLLFSLGAIMLVAPMPPLAAIWADVVHPDLRGRSRSIGALGSAASAALGPLVFGIMSDAVGLRAAFLVLLPLLGAGGAGLWLLGPRVLPRDVERMRRQLAGEEPPPAEGDRPA